MFESRLAFYYNGLNPQTMGSMSYSKLQKMHNAIEILRAEDAMLGITVSSYPHMKKNGQKETELKIKRQLTANMETREQEAPKSMKEMYHRMMGKLSGR